MTFDKFVALPVGTKIMFQHNEYVKIENNVYESKDVNICFMKNTFRTEYKNQPLSLTTSCYGANYLPNIQIISIPNNSESLKEKIQKISQEIDSKNNEKYKLELELESVLRTEQEKLLENLIPGEWYRIEHFRGRVYNLKFLDIKYCGEYKCICCEQFNRNRFEFLITSIKSIEVIKGAKEAEENFLKLVEN